MSLRDDQLATLKAAGKDFDYYNIANLDGIDHLPYSLKVLVENLVRNIDGANITDEHVKTLLDWDPNAEPSHEIQFTPSRVIMQDFTGVPCIVDLATMRDAVKDLGGDPEVINPQVQSDMVIDHSVQIDKYGIADAVQQNMDIEYQRNGERYQFLRWGQQAFKNFRVVPPGTGIIHQVNIEYLAKVVMSKAEANGNTLAYLDSCVGTDSHTTTENGLGVLGWGVGGIEAEAAMLGQPISMLVPRVVGFKLTGSIPEGVTATDVVLTITDMLRKHGVVGKFVEFYGEGIASVPLANRATIGNMGPEFGSTCGIFPIDNVTLDYLRLTGRSEEQVALVEAYAKANKLWGDASDPDYVEPQYSEYEELDLGTVVPSIAGPKRPQDRILLSEAKSMFEKTAPAYETEKTVKDPVAVSTDFRGDFDIENGDVAIASITSCTNTSNPSVMIAAGLIARNAHAKGLKPKPWVKTSLAPGSQVVADYLKAAGLQDDLDALGYQLVGFGCATCIGNSGPLLPEISEAINANDLTVTAVLSGNRNFEGRISPDVKMNYLASPPLVIAYALAGTMDFDFETQPLGTDADGNDRWLMAYHRHYTPLGVFTSGLGYHRETAIDEITFDADGLMQTIHPTDEGVSIEMADTTALDGAIEAADKLGTDGSAYTEASWKAFEDALAAAKTAKQTFLDSGLSQADVDAAAKALTDAQNALEESQPEPEHPAAGTILSIAVTAQPAKAEYKVGEALDVAGLVVTATVADGNGGSTTRELAADEYELLGFDSSKASDKVTVTVQSVADSTKTATFTVKVVADETPTPDPDLATEEELKQLEDAIAKAEAEKLNQDDYTADSWKAYANALAQAKKVLAKENATSTEVQDAIRHLTEARKALVKVSADGKKPGAVISDTGVAVFGVAGAVVVLAAAGIALTIWRKRRI